MLDGCVGGWTGRHCVDIGMGREGEVRGGEGKEERATWEENRIGEKRINFQGTLQFAQVTETDFLSQFLSLFLKWISYSLTSRNDEHNQALQRQPKDTFLKKRPTVTRVDVPHRTDLSLVFLSPDSQLFILCSDLLYQPSSLSFIAKEAQLVSLAWVL